VSVTEIAKVTLDGKTPVLIVEPQGLWQITKYAETNGIELCKVFIGGDLKTLLTRYLQRSAKEDLTDTQVAERHASRIKSLFRETEWETIYGLYDFKIYNFNEVSEKSYIDYIKDKI
jgi:hypothetical protein